MITKRKQLRKFRRQSLAMVGMKPVAPILSVARLLFWIFFPLVMLLLLALECRSSQKGLEPLKRCRYAHRGLHMQGTPENSLAAFRKALEYGYGAELDVHLMKDGRLAVVHDSNLLRVTGQDVCIEDLTAEDLPNYKLMGTKETIPLFEDVLKLFEGKTPLVVEIKVERENWAELTAAAVAALDKFNVTYCIESFDPRAIMWLRQNRPEIIRGQLSANLMGQKGRNPVLLFAVTHLFTNILACPDFIAYNHEERNIPSLWICRKIYHVQEVSWTVRDMDTMAKLEKMGNLIIFENFGW